VENEREVLTWGKVGFKSIKKIARKTLSRSEGTENRTLLGGPVLNSKAAEELKSGGGV